MRAILESYDSELTPSEHSPQLNRRMREAEEMVQKLHAHNTELEDNQDEAESSGELTQRTVGGPTLNTAFQVRPHQCRVQGHDHFPSPAGHTIFDTSQDAIGFLGHLGTLLAHIQAAVNKHPQVLFCLAAFQPLFPKPVALHGAAVAQVQDLALGLVKPHTAGPSPSIQPVQVPLQSLPTLQQINTPAQLGVICKLTEGALDPFVQIIDKDMKQNWPQHRALGNTACDRPPTGVNSIPHHSLGPAVQPVLYPVKSTPDQAMNSQCILEVEMKVLKSQECTAEQSTVITKEEVDMLRLKIEELEAERSKLEEENRSLEMKLEKLTLQVGNVEVQSSWRA
ncbi:hypothetical protein QYF61_019574 [Mycteria americana]|uniref:Uncharacterized protein n=1 Tax=Mycteria americana TaxID=33587 RepID=A0AAN7NL66_MYCAM|nr:hypothetical protein QYF61_019574 [Mycteria americana]